MKDTNRNQKPKRHVAAYMDSFTINYIHPRSPWINAWWSAAFPGLGHLMLCKYLVGYILMFWEVCINHLSGINTAIFYSLTGDIDLAAAALDKKWFLMYIGVYVFAIWDSYTRTAQLNRRYQLASREGYEVIITNISALELNVLLKRHPLSGFIWSLIVPGIGHLYINRLVTASVFIFGFITITYFSNFLPALHYSLELNMEAAKSVLNVQWFLYYPSLYVFAAYDAYVNTVEYNKIYKREQANYFRSEYQDREFDYPI
ncbi:hypothetical protein SAMN05421736_11234 [Evansella caseinilytica]|uniref:Uncharacterized protein n=1 Tax=Evansella caseinilytica TaxID=1503961 RepID=A0A1H3STZ1_9BACI|nr:hypothetical protein [Evansella caseinilytica]SDZ41414.1 hypothetical protein SAMN05421736_11234 [Evansella caseinilytica]